MAAKKRSIAERRAERLNAADAKSQARKDSKQRLTQVATA